MKLKTWILGASLFSSLTAFGADRLIFSVQDCPESDFKDFRDPLTCQVKPFALLPEAPSTVSATSLVRELDFTLALKVFYPECRSMEPVILQWKYGKASGDLNDNKLAVWETAAAYDVYQLLITPDLRASESLQSVHKDCRAILQAAFIQPNPKTVKLVSQLLYRSQKSLGLIFAAIAPDADGLALIESLSDAISQVELLQLSATDDFMSKNLEELMAKLTTAKEQLTQVCGTGSAASLCTQQTAKARQLIMDETRFYKNSYGEVKNFTEAEYKRLEKIDDTRALETAKSLKDLWSTLK